MVVEGTNGIVRPDRVFVQIRKHLLTAFEVFVDEEQYGDVVVPQLMGFFDRLFDGRPAVLAIVDQYLCVHREGEHAEVHARACVGHGFEVDLFANRRGDGRERVALRVVDQIFGDLGDAAFIKDALCAKFGGNLIFIKYKDLWYQAHWAHGDVAGPAGLHAPDRWEGMAVFVD